MTHHEMDKTSSTRKTYRILFLMTSKSNFHTPFAKQMKIIKLKLAYEIHKNAVPLLISRKYSYQNFALPCTLSMYPFSVLEKGLIGENERGKKI